MNLYSRLINIEGRRKWGQAEKVMDQALRDERQESHRRVTREYGPGVT